jgi:hypothetical protein
VDAVGWYDEVERSAGGTNSTMWLRRVRDVRRREVKLLAERLNVGRLDLCLLGAEIHVESDESKQVLLNQSSAVVGNLANPVASERTLFTCDGPGIEGPHYVIFR